MMRPSVRTTRARSGHSSFWGNSYNDIAVELHGYAPESEAPVANAMILDETAKENHQ